MLIEKMIIDGKITERNKVEVAIGRLQVEDIIKLLEVQE